MSEMIFTLIVRMVLGGFATILAIILWSKTRDVAWMFIVVATVVRYSMMMYANFSLFGLVDSEMYIIQGYISVEFFLESVSTLFYILAFFVMIFRKRKF